MKLITVAFQPIYRMLILQCIRRTKKLERNILNLNQFRLYSVSIDGKGKLNDKKKKVFDTIGLVKEFKVIKDTLYVQAKNPDNTVSNIFVREGDKVYDFKNTAIGDVKDFLIVQNADFIPANQKLLYISEKKQSRVSCKLINLPSNSSSGEGNFNSQEEEFKTTTYDIVEITDVMFSFPNLVVIKGGYEVIHVNVVNDHYNYFQLPG